MFEPIEAIKEFVRCKSVSTDPTYGEGMERSRQYVVGLLEGLGLSVETVNTPLHPIVLASRTGPPSWPHVIIYGHYDVQPPDPIENWTSPPFEPEVRGNRLYGRGAVDNKGPLLAHISAVGKLLEKPAELPLKITFLIHRLALLVPRIRYCKCQSRTVSDHNRTSRYPKFGIESKRTSS